MDVIRKQRILIIGAAGRDFHQFNTQYRKCDAVEVVGFTAAQVNTAVHADTYLPKRIPAPAVPPHETYLTALVDQPHTCHQIPHIDDRRYPAILAGPNYPAGLPIWPEHDLETIIAKHHVNRCVLAYSDLEHHTV